jgi:peptidoglycan-binding protein ArfA
MRFKSVGALAIAITLAIMSPALADYPVEPVQDRTRTTNQIVATSSIIKVSAAADTIASCTVRINNRNVACEVRPNGQLVVAALIGPKDKVEVTLRNRAGIAFSGGIERPSSSFTLANVNFNAGSAALTPEARLLLDRVAATLRDRGFNKLFLSGHTDGQATTQVYANQLSANRIRTVSNYLAAKGLKLQIRSQVVAEAKPIGNNKTRQGQALNRRVEISVRP